jgi:GAF domain-containing protein/HAMP domain-containing protein
VNRYRITNSPLWLRLFSALLLATLIPTVIMFSVLQSNVEAADLNNLTAYIAEQGQEHQQAVNNAFGRIHDELSAFVISPTYRSHLLRLLIFDSPLIDTTVMLNEYMDQRLISSGLFSEVHLLSGDGQVMLSGGEVGPDGRIPALPTGTDLSDSLVYRAGLAAVTLREDQRLTVSSEDGELRFHIVQVIYLGRRPAGFIAGTINHQLTLLPALTSADTFLATSSYLINADAMVLSLPEYREQSLASAQVSPVTAAMAQRSGTARYTVDGEEFIAHYAPVSGTPLGIITETPVNPALTMPGLYAELPGLLAVVLLLTSVASGAIILMNIRPLRALREAIYALAEETFDYPVPASQRSDEIGSLARAFVGMREQIRNRLEELQEQVTSSGRDLQATREISRSAATQRDLQTLMDQVVGLIINQFSNIYHAQIFLVDAERDYAVLRSSTGEPGRQLLSRGHRLEVGGLSVIGQVTEEGRIVLARDTSASDVHRQNEFLPETRAELAIPLRVGDEIIGALDVQSRQSDSFGPEQVDILQTMADQIAIAIENARLYQESVQRLEELRLINQQSTRRAWQEHLNYRRQRSILREAGVPVEADLGDLQATALAGGVPVVGQVTERDTIPVAIPIQLRGQTLGAVEWELTAATFSSDKVQLAQELVNRLAFSLDNARLFQESRRAIERERLVNDISARLSGQTDIDSILQTAVREVGQALGAPQVDIQLGWWKTGGGNGSPTAPDNHDDS